MLTSKIAEQHLSRVACIYIRQSTQGQVRFNQESTERQYHLKNKAQCLGWSPERIRILDRDLGQSGERTTNREDFKSLVSEVAMGHVGAIFSLEASRLARSNKDWHRLLELCAITSTLVIDEDGSYDPSEFNDCLVFGMKGTFAQAELHLIRARLHGGKLNKAAKVNSVSAAGWFCVRRRHDCLRPRSRGPRRGANRVRSVRARRHGLCRGLVL